MDLEIVGPGFDASDLNRGYLSPLESHRYILDLGGSARKYLFHVRRRRNIFERQTASPSKNRAEILATLSLR